MKPGHEEIKPDLRDIEDFEEYFDSHLEYEDSPIVIDDDITDSLVALQDIALITQDMESLQKSFDQRLQQPCNTLHSPKKEAPPSQIELHRINRGFWRLQLVCEIFRAQSRRGGYSPSLDNVGGNFVESLTHWELEEMECT